MGCHIPQGQNINIHHIENLKSYNVMLLYLFDLGMYLIYYDTLAGMPTVGFKICDWLKALVVCDLMDKK
jgi:hypothetical protein